MEPYAMTSTNHPAPDHVNASGNPPGGKLAPRWTVLLVDDEPDILSSIKLVLGRSKMGVDVLTASSGAQGLEILANKHVDLLISDFKMPVMDGIEFLAKSRELRPEVPRIMFTAYADAELEQRAFKEAFVIDFIPKTLTRRELIAKVESFLAKHAVPGVGGSTFGQDAADRRAGAKAEPF